MNDGRGSLLLIAGAAAMCAAQPPQCFGQDVAQRPARLSTLDRQLRHFDFEDAEHFNTAFPADFYRYDASSQGFPPFGRMQLTNQQSASGRWSLEFDLAGGSMSARVSPGVLPVLPHADYVVSARVKTAQLRNARVRLVAWLNDVHGKPLSSSRSESRLALANDAWDSLVVEVRGEHSDAAQLIVELQLLQPRQFQSRHDQSQAPLFEDLAGKAWFDDVVISHLPRLEMTLDQPGSVVVQPASPALRIAVNETCPDPLTARLRIIDLEGDVVHDARFPAPRGRHSTTVQIPVNRCGWYRAILDVAAAQTMIRRRWVDFVIVPPAAVTRDSTEHRFAVVVPQCSPSTMNDVPTMLSCLGVDMAVLPAWDRHLTLRNASELQAPLRAMIERLIVRDINLIMSIDCVPDELAYAHSIEPGQVWDMLLLEQQAWRPYLDELLVNFGLEASRWQIGPIGSVDGAVNGDLDSIITSLAHSMSDYVPRPSIYIPWPSEHELHRVAENQTFSISLPASVPAEGFFEFASTWKDAGANDLLVVLEQSSADVYSPRRRVVDLMVRTLHAWRDGLGCLAIRAPWIETADRNEGCVPDPAFAAWRSLAHHLSGRRFAGSLPLGDGQHCWIAQGESPNDALLIVWCDGVPAHQAAIMRSQLAAGDVTVIDAFGNESRAKPINGFHAIALDELPQFIHGVNREIVQFRGGFAIEPQFVPAVAAVHEHRVVLKNPWGIAISGTIRMLSDIEWQLSPISQEFAIQPHGEVQIPLSIIPERNILAGLKTLKAEINLTADRTYALHVQTQVEVGLRDIDLVPTWTTARNPTTDQEDLIINTVVTNKGQSTINLDVFVLGEGISQNRRTIAALGPGATAVRSFRIVDGLSLLAGKQVRVGVAERDGVTRLNRVLSITPRPGAVAQGG